MIQLRLGDCIDVMRELEPASVDAVVTDPPYGLEFMGKEWDSFDRKGPRSFENLGLQDETGRRERDPNGTSTRLVNKPRFSTMGARAISVFQHWTEQWATEALRVLKPGGHAVVFGGTRTYHRMVCGLEDAGFEIRDQLAWMFGSGFPKSLDVSKAIDAAAGQEREVKPWLAPMKSGAVATADGMTGNQQCPDCGKWRRSPDPCRCERDNGPQTDAARQWQGWGTALKPAYEPVVLARKPLGGTVSANVLEHGTGALNVDGCRIGTNMDDDYGRSTTKRDGTVSLERHEGWQGHMSGVEPYTPSGFGRWPANVVLDEAVAAMLDEQTGELSAAAAYVKGTSNASSVKAGLGGIAGQIGGFGDSGGASRFFYCAKVDSQERNAGLAVPSLFSQDGPDRNTHPTVKPVDLMRWLCRLVTPPGGLILDPFMGSGSTGIAAHLEGFGFLGVEREPEYMEIARARISHWAAQEVAVA